MKFFEVLQTHESSSGAPLRKALYNVIKCSWTRYFFRASCKAE